MKTINRPVIYLAVFLIATVTSVYAEEYTVQKGDTLLKITSEQLGDKSRWQEIADINDIKAPYSLHVGQKLTIPSTDLSNESDDTSYNADNIPFWIWALVILLSCWLFNTICLRISCWFSLVDTTFIRCGIFALIAAIAMVLCLAIISGLVHLALQGSIPWVVVPITAVTLLFTYIIAEFIFIKRFLDCKWRSVIPGLMKTSELQQHIVDYIKIIELNT